MLLYYDIIVRIIRVYLWIIHPSITSMRSSDWWLWWLWSYASLLPPSKSILRCQASLSMSGLVMCWSSAARPAVLPCRACWGCLRAYLHKLQCHQIETSQLSSSLPPEFYSSESELRVQSRESRVESQAELPRYISIHGHRCWCGSQEARSQISITPAKIPLSASRLSYLDCVTVKLSYHMAFFSRHNLHKKASWIQSPLNPMCCLALLES